MDTQEVVPRKDTAVEAQVERIKDQKSFIPKVDIFETEKEIFLTADMPGVDKDSVTITLEKKILNINGSVEWEKFEGYQMVANEYDVGDYHRSFSLTDKVDKDNIEAKVKNGVLYIILQKIKPETKKIQVIEG